MVAIQKLGVYFAGVRGRAVLLFLNPWQPFRWLVARRTTNIRSKSKSGFGIFNDKSWMMCKSPKLGHILKYRFGDSCRNCQRKRKWQSLCKGNRNWEVSNISSSRTRCFIVKDRSFISIKKHLTCLEMESRSGYRPKKRESVWYFFVTCHRAKILQC